MTITLAGGASTQSRGRRPLPAGAVSARTLSVGGVRELTKFTYADGSQKQEQLLSWVGGQWGGLWGGVFGPYELRPTLPAGIYRAMTDFGFDSPGSYGHAAEWALADALGAALIGVFASDDLSCRFFQDGGTPLAAAARVARHATGREVVASCGYHGAAAEWAHEPASAGIPGDFIEDHMRFEWGDVEKARWFGKYDAAICVEVPPVPDEEARAFLAEVRAACDAGGAIFILDEVVTGFRLGPQGAAGRYDVQPDIACYGKAMSATGCVSAIVGRADLVGLLADPVFYSTTFGGAPGPCAVAAATVRWLTEHQIEVYGGERWWGKRLPDRSYPEHYEKRTGHLREIGMALQDGFNALGLSCVGQPERSVLKFETDDAWLAFCRGMIERGVMVHRPQFPTLAHTLADVELTLEAAREVLKVMA